MYKPQNALKLPKIEDYSSQRSQPSFNASLDQSSPIQNNLKSDSKHQKSAALLVTDRESSNGKEKRGSSLETKSPAYSEQREDTYFINTSHKQNWILKKMEEQRENLKKKPQFIGLLDSPKGDPYKHGTKASQLNQVLGAIGPYSKDSPQMRKKLALEDQHISKSAILSSQKAIKAGKFGFLADGTESSRKKLEVKVDDISDFTPSLLHGGIGMTPSKFKSPSTRNNTKLPTLPPLEDIQTNPETDKAGGKINTELIAKIGEKLQAIFENVENKTSLTIYLKEYLELTEHEEVAQIDVLFLDTRIRRNLKAYMMLERTSIFALLGLINEEGSSKESHDASIRNICHYIYSNFLNFVDTAVAKLDLNPKFSHAPALEKLRQISKKKPSDVDRSFGVEQLNKLLLKVLRSSLKNAYKKGDRLNKIELLLEKIEFGIMPNFGEELKNLFQDLISKYKINIHLKSNDSSPLKISPDKNEQLTIAEAAKQFAEIKLPGGSLNSPTVKTAPPSEYHLPPAVPKAGHEHKHIYSLVLDMDETLIHFEEVGGRGRFFVRPYAEKFLKELSEIYEITIFTAGVKEYADAVLNILDPNGYIKHRLYRNHTTVNHAVPGVIKDLSKIGRDLSKTIIVDNVPENFKLQQDNGIEIISWYNDPYDTELLQLMPFLVDLVIRQVSDVRKSVRKFKEKRRVKKRK